MEKFLHDQTIREEHGIEEKCLRHTASEIFPLELRALAIAIFYSLGTLIEGVGAPILFGFLISTNSRVNVALSYGLGATLMLAGAICEKLIGVEAAGKSLESISKPLQSAS